MDAHGLSHRRSFLQGTAAAAAWFVARRRVEAAEDSTQSARAMTPRDALERLKAGNLRFVAGQSKRVPVTAELLAQTEQGQHPFATILGCSDSRVPIELIFDQGLGDLFVIRLAGNVVDTDVVGSLEYAVAHLQTRVLIVLGHEGCGAVAAALAAKEQREREPQGIQKLVEQIEPALAGIDPALPEAEKLKRAVEANVRHSVSKILAFPGHEAARRQGIFEIFGAIYELKTGRARLLDL